VKLPKPPKLQLALQKEMQKEAPKQT